MYIYTHQHKQIDKYIYIYIYTYIYIYIIIDMFVYIYICICINAIFTKVIIRILYPMCKKSRAIGGADQINLNSELCIRSPLFFLHRRSGNHFSKNRTF